MQFRVDALRRQLYYPKKAGFTIVELLVVIVVIAILAAITITAYNGIRNRSSNTRTIAGVNQFIKIVVTIQAMTGSYPAAPGENGPSLAMVCIGTGYPGGTCGQVSGSQVNESSVFMRNLSTASSGFNSVVNLDKGAVASESFQGAVYGVDSVGPPAPYTGYGRVVEWYLYGTNQNCGIGGAYAYNTGNGNTACEYFFEPIT